MSSFKTPGCFFDIEEYTTHANMGIVLSQYKDPYEPISIHWVLFLHAAPMIDSLGPQAESPINSCLSEIHALGTHRGSPFDPMVRCGKNPGDEWEKKPSRFIRLILKYFFNDVSLMYQTFQHVPNMFVWKVRVYIYINIHVWCIYA